MLKFLSFFNIARNFYIRPFLIGLLIFLTTAPVYFLLAGFVVVGYFLHMNYYQDDLRLKIKYAFSFGLGFFFANYYWMSFSMLVDFKSYWFYFFPSLVIIPAYFVIFYILPQVCILDYLHKKYRLSKFRFYLIAISIWFLFEVVRSTTLILIDFQGFSWGLLGYNFLANEKLAQIYSITGIYGASLIITFIYGSIFLVINHNFKICNRGSFVYFVSICLFVIGAIYSYGILRSDPKESPHDKKVSYLIIHPSIVQHHGFIYERAVSNIDKKIKLASQEDGSYDFVIFPEGGISFPIDISKESKVFSYILDRLDNARFLIAGATRVSDNKYYNSLFIYDKSGNLRDYYDKKYLVPFGEYTPYLKIFDSPLTNNSSGYSRGVTKSIKIDDDLPEIKPLICYDALYSMATLDKSADVIVNISNDIWFIQTVFGIPILSAAYQHLDIVRARAIETATPVLRSTNLGFSSVIDSRGRVLKKANPYDPGVLSGDLVINSGERTLYQKLIYKLLRVS